MKVHEGGPDKKLVLTFQRANGREDVWVLGRDRFRLTMVLNEIGEIYQPELGTSSPAHLLHGVERLPWAAR